MTGQASPTQRADGAADGAGSGDASLLPHHLLDQLGVYAAAVVLAWRKLLGVPDGRGDVTGLLVVTVTGGFGLALLGPWLEEHERER